MEEHGSQTAAAAQAGGDAAGPTAPLHQEPLQQGQQGHQDQGSEAQGDHAPPAAKAQQSTGAPGVASAAGAPQPAGRAALAGQWRVGDLVDVKEYGHATVVSISGEGAHQGRVQVQYHDSGATYWARPRTLRMLHPTTKRVLACETTPAYRAAAINNAFAGDVVLEIGCHEGLTTALLAARCAAVVGVDSSELPVQAARARFPKVRFEVCDGFDTDKLVQLAPRPEALPALPVWAPPRTRPYTGSGFDKIFVDIGGIAPLPTVLSLVGTLFKAFPKAVIICKSVHMARFMRQAEAFNYDASENWAEGRQ